MPLTDADIERYARQIIVPGIGASGQQSLCSSTIVVEGEPEGVDFAIAYARAAGFRVAAAPAEASCVIIAGTRGLHRERAELLAGLGCAIVWYALDGTGFKAGVMRPGQEFSRPLAGSCSADDADLASHAVAACDAVATAMGLILGWRDLELEYQASLA